MGIKVYDSFNQLKIENGSKVEYYKYSTIKSISAVSDSNADFSVVINFVANDKENALLLKLNDISNKPLWINTGVGANAAVNEISDWARHDTPANEVEVVGWGAGALGQEPMATSVPVVIASDQSAIDVDINGPLGQEPMAASIPVVISSDQSPIDVDFASTTKTAGIERVITLTAAGLVTGKASASFFNAGSNVCTVETVDLKPGESITFDAGLNNTLADIDYTVPAAGDLLITTVG